MQNHKTQCIRSKSCCTRSQRSVPALAAFPETAQRTCGAWQPSFGNIASPQSLPRISLEIAALSALDMPAWCLPWIPWSAERGLVCIRGRTLRSSPRARWRSVRCSPQYADRSENPIGTGVWARTGRREFHGTSREVIGILVAIAVKDSTSPSLSGS